MPTFATPGPIVATVVVAGAQVRVTASDRIDTVVLVEPIDKASKDTVKLSSSGGQTWIGHASADLDLSSGSGGFDIDRADGSVTAKTGDGAIRIGRLTRGQAELLNGSGNIEVGISEGTAARVDANSERGSVRNSVPPQETLTRRTTRSRSTPARGTATSSFNAQQTDLDATAARAWCVGIALVGYLWALATFRRRA